MGGCEGLSWEGVKDCHGRAVCEGLSWEGVKDCHGRV